ncbi:MAG: K+-dependent Na+/Ca+ exchanger-like protein [Chlamydiales bacterium]|jgi:K+-dependent Na+/Ca+ exchanger-like protein
MMLLFWSLVLLVSFYLLARISDEHFVVSLEKIADRFNLSSDMAGATLMAIGSSAPELFVAMAAIFKPGDHAIVGVGTIVGSALFNILVIVGVAASVKKSVVSWQPVVRDSLFYAVSIILLVAFFHDGHVTLIETVFLMGTYVVYIIVVLFWRKFFHYEDDGENGEANLEDGKVDIHQVWTTIDTYIEKGFPSNERYYAVFGVSVFYIGFLSWILVESGVAIAHILNVPEVIIGLTVLAIGTSVPDLVSSYLVAKKGKGGMAISNAVGSNIFDILIGLGLPFFLYMCITGNGVYVATEDLYISVILLFGTVIASFFSLYLRNWTMDYKTGYVLLGLYLLYFSWSVYTAIA